MNKVVHNREFRDVLHLSTFVTHTMEILTHTVHDFMK